MNTGIDILPETPNGIRGIRRFYVDVHAETIMDLFRYSSVSGRAALVEMLTTEFTRQIEEAFPEKEWK